MRQADHPLFLIQLVHAHILNRKPNLFVSQQILSIKKHLLLDYRIDPVSIISKMIL